MSEWVIVRKSPLAKLVKSMFGYSIVATKEPTTGYWMAWCGPMDSQGITLKYDVDAKYPSMAHALAALDKVVRKDIATLDGENRRPND